MEVLGPSGQFNGELPAPSTPGIRSRLRPFYPFTTPPLSSLPPARVYYLVLVELAAGI